MPPLYTYECPHCGRTDDLHRPVAERDTAAPYCPAPQFPNGRARPSKLGACGRMVRVQTAPAVRVTNPAVTRRGRGMGY